MEKIFRKLFLISVLLSASVNVNAQLSDLLGGIGKAISGQEGTGALGALGNVISSKLAPTGSQIVGTWVYLEPAIVFTSENALKNIGGNLASSAIEKKLQGYVAKTGLIKGNLSITFNQDKTFCINYKQKTFKGKYVMNGSNVTLTFNGRTEPCKMTPQLDNGSLIIAMDATRFKTFLTNIGQTSANTSLSTISTLLKSYDGMKMGVRLNKK